MLNWSLDGLVRHTVRQVVLEPGYMFESLEPHYEGGIVRDFTICSNTKWAWFAIECYKRFVPPHPSPIGRWMDR